MHKIGLNGHGPEELSGDHEPSNSEKEAKLASEDDESQHFLRRDRHAGRIVKVPPDENLLLVKEPATTDAHFKEDEMGSRNSATTASPESETSANGSKPSSSKENDLQPEPSTPPLAQSLKPNPTMAQPDDDMPTLTDDEVTTHPAAASPAPASNVQQQVRDAASKLTLLHEHQQTFEWILEKQTGLREEFVGFLKKDLREIEYVVTDMKVSGDKDQFVGNTLDLIKNTYIKHWEKSFNLISPEDLLHREPADS
jgi:hypothetical protein